jgi:hypothetical protein
MDRSSVCLSLSTGYFVIFFASVPGLCYNRALVWARFKRQFRCLFYYLQTSAGRLSGGSARYREDHPSCWVAEMSTAIDILTALSFYVTPDHR